MILDLGCNAGHTTAHFAHLYPESRIVAVEMDASNFHIARKNTSSFANCELINKAISISDGIISYSSDASAVAYRIDADKETSDASDIEVASISMNSLCATLNEDLIDYVKMDIEGEEVRIFDSDSEGLAWLDRVKSLNIEVHTGSGALEKIILVLRTLGFEAWKDQHHWSAILADRKQT